MRVAVSAPGKVILFGEHFVVYGGRAVATAVDLRVTVSAGEQKEQKTTVTGMFGTLEHGHADGEARREIRPFVYMAERMREEYGSEYGASISIASQIPPGAGLGSSSACCVAAAAAVSEMYAGMTGRPRMGTDRIIEVAVDAERTIFPRASGIDTAVSARGGTIEYSTGAGIKRVEANRDITVLIINSGQERSTADVVDRVARYQRDNPEAFAGMMRAQEALAGAIMPALKAGDLRELGRCMSENQRNLARIGASNDTLRRMVSSADRHTYGSKITGAGGGGCIIALTDRGAARWTGPEEHMSSQIDCPGLEWEPYT